MVRMKVSLLITVYEYCAPAVAIAATVRLLIGIQLWALAANYYPAMDQRYQLDP